MADVAPPRASTARSWAGWGVALWAAALAAAVLAPLWAAPGFVLSYDMVAVPQQSLLPWMWGGTGSPPRAVPQDVYVALLDDIVRGDLLQKVLLTLAVAGAGWGIARLARPLGPVGQAVAVSGYLWSAYLFERLVIGHWGLLLAYAALPWLVGAAASCRSGSTRAAGAVLLLGAAGSWVPTGGVLVVAVAGPILMWPGAVSALTRRLAVVAGLVLVQSSWLVPALMSRQPGEESEGAFGLRSEAVLPALVQAVAGDGIWSIRALPPSRQGALGIVAAVLVVGALAYGAPRLSRRLGSAVVHPLLVVATALLAWAVATGVPALGALVAWVEQLPGGGLLRDGHKWLAPWWLVVSLAFGAAAARLQERIPDRDSLRALPAALALVPVVLLPDLAWGAGGRLEPVSYPEGWQRTADVLRESDHRGDVLSLPWSTFRRYPWNADRVVLDPAPRFMPRTVVTDASLAVSSRGTPRLIPGDDPRSAAVRAALLAPDPLEALRASGIGWVLYQEDQPPGPQAPPEPDLVRGAALVHSGGGLRLYAIPGAEPDPLDRQWPIAAAWIVVAGTVAAAGGLALRRPQGSAHRGRAPATLRRRKEARG